ncbi:DeoR/GlpR family DNA-binding transcription regulator [Lactobacillus selangorensis]|uniref:DeoR/GlpR family DNA-binding transcription regulator n=1 Tax=Lactobacillus selangorensis TaxID=81857 RepID=UPI00070CDF56|nr:DeoR/GlpR family DNA-binding transcription regulator [Lactobacillus selangorensis]
MLTEERQHFILGQLKQHEVVKLQDLISDTHASESTVRRDLQILEDAGLLVRIHGGAKRVNSLHDEQDQAEKAVINVHDKERVAQAALKTLCRDDVIYLDAGTTTQALIPLIRPELNLTVVTNGVDNASLLADYHVHTLLLGGTLKPATKAIIGSSVTTRLSQLRFNKAYLGTNGIHPHYGLTTPDPDEADIKRMAIQQAEQTYILTDPSKFNQISFAKFGELNDATILTTKLPKNLHHQYHTLTNLEEVAQI